MWIEPRQHAGDRLLHQLLVVDRFDVVLLDGPEDFGELSYLFERDLPARIPERVRRNAQADQNACDCAGTDQSKTA
jgi:hypothetical protein